MDGLPGDLTLARTNESIEQVIHCVCEELAVDERYIYIPRLREKKIRWAKDLISAILRQQVGLKLTAIPHIFKLKDHSTVYYRIRNHTKNMWLTEYRQHYDNIIEALIKLNSPFVHPLSTYMEWQHGRKAPFVINKYLHEVDKWFEQYGYKLELKRKGS